MARYSNVVRIEKTEDGKQYYSSTIPSTQRINVVEYTYTAQIGDRWDTIAYKYLGSAALWYEVASANGAVNGSIFIKPGTIIRIPQL